MGNLAIALGTAATIKKALENVIDDAYNSSKGAIRRKINRWKTTKKIQQISHKAKDIKYVKTIWQVEKAVNLQEFYYPTKIIRDGGKKKRVDNIFEFEGSRVVVQGTIGQGKSIFFRYLTAREFIKGNAIPLFIELRKIGKKTKLLDYLIAASISLGFDAMDEEVFRFLLDEGKIVLLLDAFDEVKESERSGLISEIEDLASRHGNLKILISSRPNSGIENSACFNIVKLAELEKQEYQEVIYKMASNQKTAKDIIKVIKKSGDKIESVLTTPLMIALFMVRYRINQTVPENVIEFYEGLFRLLLVRHDKLKAGYVRPRLSGLTDSKLLEVFNALSYFAIKCDRLDFSQKSLMKYAKKAIDKSLVKCEPEDFCDDIIKITCLMIEEGDYSRFVHKGVAEFHAACFIESSPENLAKQFYEHMQDRNKRRGWYQVLIFLDQIDRHRYSKWLMIPQLCKVLDYNDGDIVSKKWKFNKEVLKRFVWCSTFGIDESGCAVEYTSDSNRRFDLWIGGGYSYFIDPHFIIYQHYDFSKAYKAFLKGIVGTSDLSYKVNRRTKARFDLVVLVENNLLPPALYRHLIDDVIRPANMDLYKRIADVEKREEKQDFFVFD